MKTIVFVTGMILLSSSVCLAQGGFRPPADQKNYYHCKTDCLFTSCEIECWISGSGGAVCTCFLGFATCACAGGAATTSGMSAAQQRALDDYATVLGGLNSQGGDGLIALVKDIRAAVREGDAKMYQNLVTSHRSAVERLPAGEKAVVMEFLEAAR